MTFKRIVIRAVELRQIMAGLSLCSMILDPKYFG